MDAEIKTVPSVMAEAAQAGFYERALQTLG